MVVVQVVVVEHWLLKQSPGFDSHQLPDVQFALFRMRETHHSMANGNVPVDPRPYVCQMVHTEWLATVCI